MRLHLFALLLCTGAAIRSDAVRSIMSQDPRLDPFVTVTNGVIAGQLAYTAPDLRRIWVDFTRMAKTPHTLHNVIKHELAHAKGAVHGDGSREMSYAARLFPNGDIIDDNFLL